MLPRIVTLLLISFCFVDADFSQPFNPFDPFKPFNPLDILNGTDLSPQCMADITKLSTSLAAYVQTFMACRQSQNGCSVEQQRILDENLYAVQQIDAFGKIPPGLLELTIINHGSYSECIELVAPYKTQYCYANVYIKNMSLGTDQVKIGGKLALCMPRSCVDTDDVKKFLNAFDVGGALPVEFGDTQCVPLENEYSTAFWIYNACLAFFVIWAILSTIVDYALETYYKKKIESKALEAFLSYSLYSNGSLLLSVSPPKKGTIKSLPAIRFVSMTWVLAGHVLMQDLSNDRFKTVLKLWDPILSLTIINGFFSVDTFFLLSGILVSYLFFKVRPSAKYVRSPVVWIMYYVHRYLRLTPPIMMFIGFYTVYNPLINGPWSISMVDLTGETAEVCVKYWWRNLLYINNFFGQFENCYAVTWYLAVDTQLYFIAPIFLITFFFSAVAGYALIVLCSAGSVAYVYAVTVTDSLPATMSFFARDKLEDFFSKYYNKPWGRCPVYLIGIAVGYFLASGKKPKLNKVVVICGWIVATAIGLAAVYGPHGYMKGVADWSDFIRGSYNNFSRVGWAIAVSWVIIANHLGYGGIIADFMDHPIWQPLGRLSYCGYIVHMFLIHYIYNLDDRPAHFVSIWRTYIHLIIPNIVVSYVFSFFWSCLFEVPVVKLEKLLTAGLLPNKKSVQAIQPKSALTPSSEDGKAGNINGLPSSKDAVNVEDQKASSGIVFPESVVVKKPEEEMGKNSVNETQSSTITTKAQVYEEDTNESNVDHKL